MTSPTSTFDLNAALTFSDSLWESDIVPTIAEYIKIPNKSPLFDPDWSANGHMDRATDMIADWCRGRPIDGLTVEIVRLEGRTPLIYMEIPGSSDDTVLLYGHLDKQPEMTGWREGLSPWKPVREGDKLYGRGGADDGYAAFASLTAIEAVRKFGGTHARCVVLIEACEESGSPDLPHYIEHLKDRIGTPSLVVCLDSGCGNYDQLWCTTSLRGIVVGTLRVDILTEGVHSGNAGGIAPSSFRIARMLLSRLENVDTGEITADAFIDPIPAARVEQAKQAARVLGDQVVRSFPFVDGAGRNDRKLHELILDRTWRSSLSVTGSDGLPALEHAGNVLRPFTSLQLSLRVPPTRDAGAAAEALKTLLEADPPYGANVSFTIRTPGSGWEAPAVAPWLEASLERVSQGTFGKSAMYMGEGGSIPFMGMLGEAFPEAQFLITGVLGPHSNAHGPNEFLHIPTGKKLTAAIAGVLDDHACRK